MAHIAVNIDNGIIELRAGGALDYDEMVNAAGNYINK